MFRVDKGDFYGGLLLAAVGLVFFVTSFDYTIGTPRRMGPGFLPMVIAGINIFLGLAIAVPAIGRSGPGLEVEFRQITAVLASIAVFGLMLERVGLIPAAFCTVLVAALGDPTMRGRPALILAIVVSIGAWIVFSLGLGLPLQAFAV